MSQPLGPDQLIGQALASHQGGDLARAESLYQQVLALAPNHGDALHLLGLLLNQKGQSGPAIESIRKSVAMSPGQPLYLTNLAEVLRAAGHLAEAESTCRRAIVLAPGSSEGHSKLGDILRDMNRLDDAIISYGLAVTRAPGIFLGHYNLAVTLQALNRLTEAAESYRTTLRLKPDFPEAHNNLANVLLALGRPEEAVPFYREALRLQPRYMHGHYNLGNAFTALGAAKEAEQAFRKALEIGPDFAEAHYNLGNLLAKQGRVDEALSFYERAHRLAPDAINITSSLGNLLLDLHRFADAQAVFRHAAETGPESLGFAFREHVHLPRIAASNTQIAESRSDLSAGIDLLSKSAGSIEDPYRVFGDIFFYLAYHGLNDRPIMESIASVLRTHANSLNFVAPHCSSPTDRQQARNEKIHIGFVSQFLHQHTIGKLTKGIIARLDREKFEVSVIHTWDSRVDPMRREIDASADRVIVLPDDIPSAQRMIAGLRLDALHYPDIGMSPFTYLLAYARLAPVQTVTWGHPVTTGIDTVDYFLSFAAAECPEADAHYSERLVRLSRPPVYYELDIDVADESSRQEFDLPPTGNLYGCPQSLFKLHPEFDVVLAEILERDPEGWIVLIDGTNPVWKDLLRARWSKAHPILHDRTLFLPRVPRWRFLQLIRQMDVLLDPIHFGSGNTLYEALGCGVPIVTWPSAFLRGRIVGGAYALLGITDAPIAGNGETAACGYSCIWPVRGDLGRHRKIGGIHVPVRPRL